MTMQTITDNTPLSDLLDSKVAVEALLSRGLATVGSLKARTLPEIAAVPGVGERTMEQIRNLRILPEQPKIPAVDEIVESESPIHLHSPHGSFALQVLPGDVVPMGAKGMRSVPPIYISFHKGRGSLSKKEWLMRKHKREILAVEADLDAKVPWRVDAAKWLRSRQGYRREFFIMSD